MTPANRDTLREGMEDGEPTLEEAEAILAEAENFRQPAPAPIPVRKRFYLTECEHCGWVGSSEHCGNGGGLIADDIVCPVCCSSICGDAPDEADTAKHGEAVYQRITAAEARADRLSAEVEALRESLRKATALPLGSDLLRFVDSLFDVDPDRTADEIIATVQARDPDALEKQVYNALGYLTRRKRVRRLAYGRYTALARAAVKAETEGSDHG
ncbi:hypothetical protein [Methylorubrum suomiense]|uniref:Uncharacterized protein n=1 Tax=Methylorubrum suomiense TaxID=144191 RepID=A0ABQ4UZ71_9HYPH|nr:hypothetical protein [Methylorubrum suomiense]GJE77194.1 hypothetical protein BGCPKDLD_3797 [Methylorubrum suomiense]